MGIKHFWIWFKEQHGEYITTHHRPKISTFGIDTDMLAIDMNGIFHTCAQKVFRYGNYAPRNKNLITKRRQPNYRTLEKRLFEAVAAEVDLYRRLVNPKKRLLLCVDGIAGMAKMSQQRQRRFRSAKESSGGGFDSNCITPGTRFMNNLSKYLDWYIRMQVSVNPEWQHLEVIFSNEKVPGEGEHKIVHYLRKYRTLGESCCIHGMDADLIMLGLASPCEDIYILRDDSFKHDVSHMVNLGKVRVELSKRLNNGATGNVKHINDFLLMCYAVGNDFLPHAPGIEILSGGIDTMIEIYNDVEEEYGYLSRRFRGQLRMCKESFSHYLEDFSSLEEEMFNKKLNGRHSTFPDPVMDKYIHVDADGKKVLNIEEYKKEYYATKFPNHTVEQVCNEYIFGMRWVLDYYTSGIPMWSWCYPWHYSPFMSDVAKFMPKFSCKKYGVDEPFTPFQQLMTVLPEKSAHLLPAPIGALMKESSSTLGAYFPADFEIDMAGKRREWEGIVLLPKIDKELFFSELAAVMPTVDPRDLSRNKPGKIFSYSHIKESRFVFKSYYGDITENYCNRRFVDF